MQERCLPFGIARAYGLVQCTASPFVVRAGLCDFPTSERVAVIQDRGSFTTERTGM